MKTSGTVARGESMIARAMEEWGKAFSSNSVENILALYEKHACLWGKLSPVQRTDSESIRDYFDGAFKYKERKVIFEDSTIRCYGDMAISSGRYTFSFVKDGEQLTMPSRFSLVYTLRDGKWLIVEHHSSIIPDD